MRTTVDLPDSLFRQAKAHAALLGLSFKDLLTHYVEQGLRREGSDRRYDRPRSEPPLARAATGRSLPILSNAELFELLDEP